MTVPTSQIDALAIGRGALRQLHQSLLTRAPDHAIAILQEAGFASGDGTYQAFCGWLPGATGIARPEEIDTAQFNSVLSEFFAAQGWGTVSVQPIGGAAFAVDSGDWAEADPGSAQTPMCFFSTGMLADFLGRITGDPVAVMEVECRSRGDGRCRFLAASPETLQQVYEAMTQGKSYEETLSS